MLHRRHAPVTMNIRDPEILIVASRWSAVATILILDNDLGFSFWLGQSLTAPHCRALPAKSVAEAIALIGQFKLRIDFLIMNPAVPGASDFTRALRKEQRHLRVATLTPEIAEAGERPESLQPVMDRGN